MAKVNPHLINSIIKDLQEICFVVENMIPEVEDKDFKSWIFPNKLSKQIKIDIEIFENLDGGQYVLLLELIIDRLYLIFNLTIEYLQKDMPGKSVPKDVSLGLITTIFWKKLQNCSRTPSNTDVLAQKLVTQIDNLYVSPCKSCTIAMEMMKIIIKSVEECMVKLKINSEIKKYRLALKQDIVELSQNAVMKNWIDAVTKDLHAILEFSVTTHKETLSIQGNMKSLEEHYHNSSQECKKLKKEIQKLQKMHSEAEKNIIKLNTVIKQTQEKYSEVLNSSNEFKEESEKKIANLENEIQIQNENHEKVIQELNDKAKTELEIERKKLEENYVEVFTSFIKLKNESELKIENLEKELEKVKKEHERDIIVIEQKTKNEIEDEQRKTEQWIEKYKSSETKINELKESLLNEQNNTVKLQKDYEEALHCNETKFESELNNIREENKKLKTYFDKAANDLKKYKNDFETKTETLNNDYNKLKNEMELAKKREYALLQCPDLNGPINPEPCDKRDPLSDMVKQVEANQLRIELLQQQNSGLQKTVDRLRNLKKKM